MFLNSDELREALLDDYRWLVGSGAEPWLRRAAESDSSTLATAESFRRELSSNRVHLVLEQIELRHRGRSKFAAADKMFFTRTGLEQATDQVVAAYKARRFAASPHCVDLCCGIGGDLLALARRASQESLRVLGVDRDHCVALLAAANAGRLGLDAAVAVADAERFALSAGAIWHLDPDRRPGGRRSTRPQWHSPSLPAIERLIGCAPHGAIKLAPAADVPATWINVAELEWISRRRQCRQLVVWLGDLATSPGSRKSTVLHAAALDDEPTAHSLVGQPNVPIPSAVAIGDYVFEPDSAVLAARLSGELARRHALKRLAADSVYLTGDQTVDDPLVSCFKVEESLPFDRKHLKKLLANRGIERLEIKQRGLDINPQRLRRELHVDGDPGVGRGEAVLILARRSEGTLAILANRII